MATHNEASLTPIEGEPPAQTRGRGASKYARLAEQLKENPGVWYKVETASPTSAGSSLRKMEGIQVTTRDGGKTIYAKA